MRTSPLRHNLARLRVYLGLRQKEMSHLVGSSVATIQSVELRRLVLSEDLARRVSSATGIHLRWLLENNLSAEPVTVSGAPYTKSQFEHWRAQNAVGNSEFVRVMTDDYAVSFYGQIVAVLASAVKKNRGELAIWKIASLLEDCRRQFGHDKSIIAVAKQFGLRDDDTVYLKHRQVEAGIALFKAYLKQRRRKIRTAIQQLTKLSHATGDTKAKLSPNGKKRRKTGNKMATQRFLPGMVLDF